MTRLHDKLKACLHGMHYMLSPSVTGSRSAGIPRLSSVDEESIWNVDTAIEWALKAVTNTPEGATNDDS